MQNEYETAMRIVKSNLEILCARLQNLGYVFSNSVEALSQPDIETASKLTVIQEKVGKVPEALAAFYRIVGSVDFTGHHPDWNGCEYPDALFIYPIVAAVEELDDYFFDTQAYHKSFVTIQPFLRHETLRQCSS